MEDTASSGSKWSWVSWAKVVEAYGLGVAQEMVNTGCFVSRKYLWVDDAKTTLTFPDTHEFRVDVEGGSNFRTKNESMEEDSGKVDGDAEKFDEVFEQKVADVYFMARPKPKAPPKDKTENQKVLAELKAAHRAWDEQKQNLVACVEKAEKDEYVSPKLVSDLKRLIKKGKDKDAELSKQEVQEKNGKVWNESDLKAIRLLVAQLKNETENAKKLVKKIDSVVKDE